MNPDWTKHVRRAAAIGASVVVVCVLILTASYVAARIMAPRDARIVEDLKKKVRQDSSVAPKLEAEQKRITAALARRKKLDNLLAIVLVAAAALFIASAKWIAASPGRRPLPMDRLVQLKAGPKVGHALARTDCPTARTLEGSGHPHSASHSVVLSLSPRRSPQACLRADRNHARADCGHVVVLLPVPPFADGPECGPGMPRNSVPRFRRAATH
jgi:hypothetical protein